MANHTILDFLVADRESPPSLEVLIESEGIQLEKNAKLHNDIVGQLELLEENGFRISTNRQDHDYRKRFTMAHELGHWAIHQHLLIYSDDANARGVDDNKAFRSTDVGNFYNTKINLEHEREANRFAAVLLMPKGLIMKHHDLNFKNYPRSRAFQRMYHYFKVSPAALRWRLKSLGLETDVA